MTDTPKSYNVALFAKNLASTCTLSGGSWLSALPLTNMQDRVIGTVARSTDATTASTRFVVDLGISSRVDFVALVGHNISTDGTWRILGSDTGNFDTELAAGTLLYNSGSQPAWPLAFDPSTLEWEDENFWTATWDDGISEAVFQWIGQAAPVYARYLRIEITDTANLAGYVDIGELFLSKAWQSAYNMIYGATLAYEDPTVIDTALGGTEYFDVRPKYRVLKFTLDNMDYEEGYSRAQDLIRTLGTHGELFVVMDPTDTLNQQRRSFMGRLRTLSPLDHYEPTLLRMPFEIKELT